MHQENVPNYNKNGLTLICTNIKSTELINQFTIKQSIRKATRKQYPTTICSNVLLYKEVSHLIVQVDHSRAQVFNLKGLEPVICVKAA